MDWEDCLGEKVSKTSPNKETARSLLVMCRARMEIISGMDKKYPALVAEAYYEVLKELVTALMSADGFKSYSHKCLTAFLDAFYFAEFEPHEVMLMEKLRVLRNDIGYRGVFAGDEFLERNEERIRSLITKLFKILEGKL